MHVLIVGAGEIGYFLAQRLRAESHDVVVVEANAGRAAAASTELDVQVIVGSGTSPATLTEAGIQRAEMVAAVTQADEVNLVASMLAAQAGVENRVVRLQSEELRGPAGQRLLKQAGATLVIDPDAETADEILELVHSTGADEIYPLAGGDLVVIGGFIAEEAPLAGRYLAEIAASYEPNWEFLFGAVTRNGETSIPRGDQQLLAGDHVRVVATRSARREILELLGASGQRAKRVMVLGGGAIGARVATHLEAEGVEVVLIERDAARADALAARLHKIVVIQGDITDTDLLHEEAVGTMDAVIAAAGEDAANVLACAYAAAEGAGFTVAVLHRLALLPLVRRFGINAALSPRTASANAVLRHVRGGMSVVATFLESDAEVDQIEIEPGSPADGVAVKDLHLPRDILIGAVIREDHPAQIVRGSTELRGGDRVVVFGRPNDLGSVREFFGK